MGQLVVLSQHGDNPPIVWDPDDEESTRRARKEWDRLKKEGYEFFKTEGGERVTRWNRKLGTIIVAPGVQTAQEKSKGEKTQAMAGGPKSAMVMSWISV